MELYKSQKSLIGIKFFNFDFKTDIFYVSISDSTDDIKYNFKTLVLMPLAWSNAIGLSLVKDTINTAHCFKKYQFFNSLADYYTSQYKRTRFKVLYE